MRRLLVMAVTSVLLAGCHKTEEDRVRAMLDDGVDEVEAGKVGSAVEHLSTDFKDDLGDDRDAVKGILLTQVLRGEGSVAIYRRNQTVEVEGETAKVSLDALLTRGKRQTVLGAVPADAQTFHFDFALVKQDGEWKIRHAKWRETPPGDFLKL